MKKQLLTTTALVAAGVLVGSAGAFAQANGPAVKGKPSLTIGGWLEGIVGGANNDDSVKNDVGWDVQTDSEFLFQGRVTLDNGIKIRTQSELEGEVSGDQWDEVWVSVSGSFGAIRIGSEDNAAHLMVTPYSGSWATEVGQNLSLDTADWLTVPGGFAANKNIRLSIGDSDSDKVTYFTPRVAGFQLGVSYLPSFEECQAATNGSQVTNNTNCNSSIAAVAGHPHNGWAAAVNFDRKFDGIRVGLATGFVTAKRAPDTEVTDGTTDPHGWSVGGLVGFGGFKLSAGYKAVQSVGESAGTSGDHTVYNVGGAYKFGLNAVSIGWEHVKAPGSRAIADDDKLDRVKLSYQRNLGPGVQYRLNFFYADYKGEDDTISSDDNSGYAATTSIRVAF